MGVVGQGFDWASFSMVDATTTVLMMMVMKILGLF